MLKDGWQQLNDWSQNWSLLGKIFLWIVVAGIFLLIFYLLISLILGPFMWLYNRLTDRNVSNVPKEKDFIVGELTGRIVGSNLGEVMITDESSGRSTHPAQLFKRRDLPPDYILPIGTKVLIIDFDEKGVAQVVERKDFL